MEALAEALKLHEEKGNLLPAQRCREELAALGAITSAMTGAASA